MRIRVLLALALLPVLTQPANALLCGSILSPVTVSATPLSFGTYLPGLPSPANATIKVSCAIPLDLLIGFHISLSAGNAVGHPSARYLKHGTADQLSYNIYTGSGTTDPVWGDGSDGTVDQTYAGLLSIGAMNFTAYGRLPQNQFVAPGAYTDRITVTVSY